MLSALSLAFFVLASCLAQSLPSLTPRQLAVDQLVNASRILALHGIADDGPGHISVRDPLSPNQTFLLTAGTGTPAQITPADIAVVRINDSVVVGAALNGFNAPPRPSEVFLHSSVYQRFPNTTVSSVAYYGAEKLLPWTLYSGSASNSSSPATFLPVIESAAFLGPFGAPVFSIFDTEPNTTTAAIDNTIKGFALATSMGPEGAAASTVTESPGYRPLVLMRFDGATVSGLSVVEVVFRFMAASKNAGVLSHLTETSAAFTVNRTLSLPNGATRMTDNYLRSWLLWMRQIEPSIIADQSQSPGLWNLPVNATIVLASGSSVAFGTVRQYLLLAVALVVPITMYL